MGWLTDRIIHGIMKKMVKEIKEELPNVKAKALEYIEEYKEELIEKVKEHISKVVKDLINKAKKKV